VPDRRLHAVISHGRWQKNWLVVGPPDAVEVDLGRPGAARGAPRARVRGLPAGTPVVLRASAPLAHRRSVAFASGADIEVERAYLAFPSAAAPAYLVEDAQAPVRVFVASVLVTPPGFAWPTAMDAALRLLRTLAPWRLIRAVAPGRVVVGRCR
jgi:hypothetical protein